MTSPAPAAPADAAEVFGDRLDAASRFAGLLADAGVVRGLIGPREVPALWSRHLVNCALITDFLPVGARVVDVGSGAGLPGVVLAVRRVDLEVDLVEPLARRCAFLQEAVDALDLGPRVRVHRGRADELAVVSAVAGADVVTARALAPLERLVRWCLPLVRPGGELLAIKGARAEAELADAERMIGSLGGRVLGIESVSGGGSSVRMVRIERSGSRTTRKA